MKCLVVNFPADAPATIACDGADPNRSAASASSIASPSLEDIFELSQALELLEAGDRAGATAVAKRVWCSVLKES
jgi:hypothetical protein